MVGKGGMYVWYFNPRTSCEVRLSDKVRIIAAFKNRKPVICIEIKNGAVAQAKLVNNQPVRDDAELNRALLAWAKSRKLTIETNDVQTERGVTGVAAAV